MKALKKLFGEINMTWQKVIIFAIIAGLFTGGINMVPFLADTSFTDIAVDYPWWVFFALIIITNCKKPVEAGLKTFVFFLISQPLVYLIEMPWLGTSVWQYYKYWAVITVLTLPGGMIAYFSKKQNILGSLILSCALVLLGMNFAQYTYISFNHFPKHILSAVFTALIALILILAVREKKHRLLPTIIAVLSAVIFLFISFVGFVESSSQTFLPEGEWIYVLENEDVGTVQIDGTDITYSSSKKDSNKITCTNTKTGETIIFDVTVDDQHLITITQEN